jgi:hypothetical protein
MAQEQSPPPVADPPAEPLPPPPVSPDIARPNALFTFSSAANAITISGTALRQAKTSSEPWADEYWNASGYDRATVTAALDRLIEASEAFAAEHNADIEILRNQT